MLFRFSFCQFFCLFFLEAQNDKAKDIRYRVQVQELASESPDWDNLLLLKKQQKFKTDKLQMEVLKVKMQL